MTEFPDCPDCKSDVFVQSDQGINDFRCLACDGAFPERAGR
jgi:tRNA(Ile2) C34 agmatinyltransferase TiaS